MTYTTLQHLPEGALFKTQGGILAVKSEYHYGNEPNSQCQCVLLASGEYAHFPLGNAEPVREIDLEGALAELSDLRASLALAARDDATGKAELGAAVEREAVAWGIGEKATALEEDAKAADPYGIRQATAYLFRELAKEIRARGPALPLPDAGEVERLRAIESAARAMLTTTDGCGPSKRLRLALEVKPS